MNHNNLIENNRGNTPTTVSTEEENESSNHETEDKKEKVDIEERENGKKDGDINRNEAV